MADTTTRILLIEDNPGDVRLICEMIAEANGRRWEINSTGTLREATEILEREPVDAVLLDLGLPDSNGLETFRRVSSLKPTLPIIVLSGLNDEEIATQSVREGSQDYLVKGQIEPNLLARSIRYAIERKRNDQLKTNFINNASHELRTPLSILKISLSNLNKHFADSMLEQQKKMLLVAEKNADRLMRFINNLLDFARLEAGKGVLNRRYVDVAPVLDDVIQNFRVEATERGLEIESSISPDLPEVYIDDAMIERVLGNLLSNAIHFAKKTIRIEARTVNGHGDLKPGTDESDRTVSSGKPPELRGLLIGVIDDGVGLEPEQTGKLFGKFEQVQNQGNGNGYKGTGLGLAICREIMEKHQANIWVESTPGSGASFHLLFPSQ